MKVPEYEKEYYTGESLLEVVRAIRSVARKRISNNLYWSELTGEDDLKDIFLSSSYNFFQERLIEITNEIMRAYLAKVSDEYKEFNLECGESYGYTEDHKIIDALLSINNRGHFLRLCYDLFDDLKFEV
jgi:hypothetical protein